MKTANLSSLTPRQRAVVELRGEGKTNRQVAEELGIDIRSVEVHLWHAKRRLAILAANPPGQMPEPAAEADANYADDDVPPPALAKARAEANGERSRTIPARSLTKQEKRAAALIVYPEDVERPRTRGECANGPRPCPWISCAHHLYLDVDQTGAIKLNFPNLDVDQMRETCALDIADKGGVTLEEVGAATSTTRERARQVEEKALRKIRRQSEIPLGLE